MRRLWPVLALAACVPDAPTLVDPPDEWDQKLNDRVVDYGAALRVAALRLTGELPTITEIETLSGATDQAQAYATQVRAYMTGPRFARQMFHYWQDTLKLGDDPELDTGAAFAAQVTVAGRPFTDLFTATAGTCTTYDPATSTFASANCTNGVPQHAGLLTHPGVNRQFVSNFGFRRVRWLQETFACTAFPAEIAPVGANIGGATPYTGTFPFDSIAGMANGGRVDFLDKSAVICANCHSNINHIAPLFAHFDPQGTFHPDIVATTPLPGNPVAVASDYLPSGEPLAWRHGVTVSDMPSLGHAIAADPVAANCAIARLWNWALGKSDIVDGGNRVPTDTTAAIVQRFTQNNMRVDDAIFAIFTSDDFVRF